MQANARQKKYFIFDMDGTIINSEPLHINALVETFKRLDINTDITSIAPGTSDWHIYQDLEISKTMKFDEYIEIKNKILIEMIESMDIKDYRSLLSPGVTEFIDLLFKQNHSLALVSASETPIVDVILNKLNIKKYFPLIHSRQKTFLSKPSASPYLRACRELGIKTNQAIIFEDSIVGLTAARSSGANTIQVRCFTKESKLENIQEIISFKGLDPLKLGSRNEI